MIQTFANRLNDLILRPKLFFEEMEITGGFKEPLIFSFMVFLPVTVVGIVLYLLGMPQMIVLGDVNNEIGGDKLTFLFVMRGVVWGGGLFLMSLLYHIGFKIVGGTDNFEATYRIVAYSSATYLFNLIPRIGILIYCFYSLLLVIIGGKIVHKVTTGKSIIGPLIPIVFAMFLSMLIQLFTQ